MSARFAMAEALPTHAFARGATFQRRLALVAGCLLAVALAAWLGHPAAHLRADAGLAHLLRGMAAIKAVMVSAAVAVLWWRLGRPLAPPLAAVYVGGPWVLAGATAMIWQLWHLPLAVVLFHGAEIGILIAAWHEHRRAA